MGASLPIIGLGMQAVSAFSGGGGTQYSPDPKAKYKADLMALDSARQLSARQIALLNEQKDVANQIADYQRESDYWSLQAERDLYKANLDNQYQQGIYQNQLERAQQDIARTGGDAASLLKRRENEQNRSLTDQNLNLDRNASFSNFDIKNTGRDIQASQAGAQQGFALDANALQRAQLGLDSQGLDLQGQRLDIKGDEIVRGRKGVELAKGQADLSTAYQLGQLGIQEGGANIQRNQAISNAELQRQQQMDALFNVLYGNQQKADSIRAVMSANGILPSAQGAQINQDMNLDPRVQNQRRQARAQYGDALGNANVNNQLDLAGIDLGRANVNASQRFNDMGFDLQREGLTNEWRGLGIDREDLNLARQSLGVKGRGIDLDDRKIQSEYRSYMDSLANQKDSDILNMQILPDAKYRLALQELQNRYTNTNQGLDIEDFMRQASDQLSRGALDTELEALTTNRRYGEPVLNADLARQIGAIDAAKTSSKQSNDIALAAALSQLAAGQYGLLSSVGSGLGTGYPSGGGGGGINLDAIGGLIKGIAGSGLLSGGNYGSQRSYSSPTVQYSGFPTQSGYYNA